MKPYFGSLESVVADIGVKPHDCHPDVGRGGEYHQLGFGVGAISLEEAVCLYGLVFITRPHVIIELGTETGASSLILGAAAKDLGFGRVVSIDRATNPPIAAINIRDKYSLPIDYVTGIDSVEYLTKAPFDQSKKYLVFSDTDIKVRPTEVELVKKHLPVGTIIAVHDTSDEHPFGPMNLKDKTTIPLVELPSPRGLTILRT